MNPKQVLNKLLRNKEFAKEWAKPDAMDLQMIRINQGITQKELAKRIGAKQSAISRLENNPEKGTLDFIGKVAYGLGLRARLVFDLIQEEKV